VARPNILLVHADQHRWDCLGAYGNPDVRTPHLDKLASEGVRFEHSYCPYPVCTPSRYSLLSGLYVNEHRGWSNRCTLAPGTETFPRILRKAGYSTAAVGKMHFTPTYLDVGFDRMFLAEQDGDGRWDDDYHRYLMDRGLVDRIDLEDQRREFRKHAPREYWSTLGALVSDLPDEHHSTTWVGDRALEVLESWKPGTPGLLMVGFIKPHHPFDPPAPWYKMYDPRALTLLPGWTETRPERDRRRARGYFPNDRMTEAQLRRAMACYYATISHIDHHVGRLLDLLRRKGLYDNTIVLYTSDHGDYLGFHHMLLKGNHMYDPLVRVPLIIKWADGKGAGTVSNRLVNNVDVAPTMCRAAGCQPGPRMYGQDLRTDGPGHEYIFCEVGRDHVMVRTRTRKLLRQAPKDGDLLFDLQTDPLEMTDVSGVPAYVEDLAALRSAAEAWRPRIADNKPYLDPKAPQIDQPNVPPRDLSHRKAIIDYTTKRVAALRAKDTQ
jgi:arylsulfatase A-like enzyme